MGDKGFDNKTHTTTKGKVVYKRKKHTFDAKSLHRILTNLNNELSVEDASKESTAIKIRAIFIVASSLYAMVDDMFEQPANVSNYQYNQIKSIWRTSTDDIIFIISEFIAEKSGSDELGEILNTVGRLINRGMEYILTGHTEF